MSISDSRENINRREGLTIWLFGVSAMLGIGVAIGFGYLFERVNIPAPIEISCSEEVLKGLLATSSVPIPAISNPKGKGKKSCKK